MDNSWVKFENSGFDAIQSQTVRQQQACQEIWDKVRIRLLALGDNQQVDAQIDQVLRTREEQFHRDAGMVGEAWNSNHRAVGNTQQIGITGGQQMVKAAWGQASA
jgi:hypothetical protein